MRKFIVLVLLMTVATSIVAQESKEHEKISPYLESLICGEDARDIRRAPSTETLTITLLAKLAEDADEEELAEKYGVEKLLCGKYGDFIYIEEALATFEKSFSGSTYTAPWQQK